MFNPQHLFLSAVFFLAANALFFFLLVRVFSAKNKFIRIILGIILFFCVFLPLLLNIGVIMLNIYFLFFYFIIRSQRLSSTTKFWTTSIGYFIFLCLLIHPTGDQVVRMNFFNFFFTLPFSVLSQYTLFSGSSFNNVVENLISTQSFFCFRYILGILIFMCLGTVYMMFKAISKYTQMKVKAPELENFKLPKWLLPIAVVLYFLDKIVIGSPTVPQSISYLWAIVMALYTLQGICIAFIIHRNKQTASIIIFLIFCLCILSSQVMLLFCFIGMVDGLTGLRTFFISAETQEIPDSLIYSTPRGYLLPVGIVIVCILLPALIIASRNPIKSNLRAIMKPTLSNKGDSYSFSSSGSEVLISGPDGSYYIDRYEFPNQEGVMPQVSATREEARQFCQSQGKRLCTIDEWSNACRAGSNAYTSYLTDKRETYAKKLLKENCGQLSAKEVVKSGDFPKCQNPYGVHDMIGNLWEIVETPEGTDFDIIMGQGFRSNFVVYNQCHWVVLIYPRQFRYLPTEEIGFRCCRSEQK